MILKEKMLELYKYWQEELMIPCYGETMDDVPLSEREQKILYFIEFLVPSPPTTYDDGLSVQIGEEVFKSLKQIYNGTAIKCKSNINSHVSFIRDTQYFLDWLDWEVDIVHSRFDYGLKFAPYYGNLLAIGYDNKFVDFSEEFIDWLMNWIS